MSQKKEAPTTRPIDPKDFKEKMDNIIDNLARIDIARESITEDLKYLKSTYGKPVTRTRAAAMALHKQSKDQIQEITDEVLELIELYGN